MPLSFRKLFFTVLLFAPLCAFAQKKPTFLVYPFLQDAQPNSIIIKWETSFGEESVVEWGETNRLGNKAKGKAESINFGESRIHEVQLTGLERLTTYYYRVITDGLRSDIYQFKTPPFPKDDISFNMVAMSDMQRDHNEPEKFAEMVNEGVLKYMKDTYGGEVPENLALVMIPGDLVVTGSVYSQWQEHFFKPAKDLFTQVPVYPVLGNHEQNSLFYFKYFSLPENGTGAYAEHWWFKDYGNTRIIGLDSNDGYRDISQQLSWLKNVLAETAKNDDIDFVFAQMHHPHKSELWIPGETDFSGKIVKMLEDFSTATGKPSVHFFGHTHGYSRGQSRDHKHLWINVATAGGAIDNWGEFEGRDYDEFTVTEDEYGFVMVEVEGNADNPKFTVKRISRGNQENPKDNVLTDSVTVFRLSVKPQQPSLNFPSESSSVNPLNLTLKASQFQSDMSEAFHAASNWQIAENAGFERVVFDSWKQHENWYYKENRQEGDDLTDEKVTERLKPNTTYYVRVRYRDQNLNWSDWSEVVSFKTSETSLKRP
jgi:hypothetical protein